MANGESPWATVRKARVGFLTGRDPEDEEEGPVLGSEERPFTSAAAAAGRFGGFNLPVRTRQTAGARFTRGVGRGIVHPVQSLLPGDSEDLEDLGTVGAVGQVAGAIGSFIPAFVGSTKVLQGIGLLSRATAGSGRTALFIGSNTAGGRLAAEAARGGLATGAFEAFAGEDPSEAPTRFLAGAALGAAGDAAIMGAVNRFRGGFGAWKGAAEGVGETRAVRDLPIDAEVVIHPEALRLERMMNQKASDGTIEEMLGGIGEPQDQLREVMLRMTTRFSPRGSAVVPRTDRNGIRQLSKAIDDLDGDFGIEASRPFEGEDLFDVWIYDKARAVREPETNQPALSRVLSALEDRFPDLDTSFPDAIEGNPSSWGRWQNLARAIQVRSTDPSPLGMATTLMHEAFHEVNTGFRAFFNASSGGQPRGITRSIWEAFRGEVDKFPTDMPFSEFQEELREMTARAWLQKTKGPDVEITDKALESAKKTLGDDLAGSDPYFWSDKEVNNWAMDWAVNNIREADQKYSAHRLLFATMDEFAPQFSPLLRPETRIALNVTEDAWRRTQDDVLTVFREGPVEPTPEALDQFRRFGWAPGMPAYLDGKTVNIVKRVEPAGKFLVRNLDDGSEAVVGVERLQRAGLEAVAREEARVLRAVDQALNSTPRSIPVSFGTSTGSVRAILDTNDFTTITSDVRTWVRGLPEGVRDQLRARHGQLRPRELSGMGEAPAASLSDPEGLDLIDSALELTGSKGLVQNDNGILTIFTRDPDTSVTLGEAVSSSLSGDDLVQTPFARIFRPSPDDIIEQQLRIAGVPESDMPFFLDRAKKRFGDQILELADVETKQVAENAKVALKAATPDPEDGIGEPPTVGSDGVGATVARAGMEMEPLPSGRVLLRDARSRSILAEVADEDEAFSYANDLSVEAVGPDLGDFPGGAATGNGGAAPPPKPQDPLIPSTPKPPGGGASRTKRRGWWTNLENSLFGGKHFTALENTAKKFENLGLGAAYTQVYLPLNNAMLRVNSELSTTARTFFGGLTFKDKFDELNDLMVGIRRKRQPLVSGWVEAATKDEIRQAGGLMQRAMTERELDAARFIESVGLQHDVPELMSAIRLIDGNLEGKMTDTIRRMQEIELSPEAQQLVTIFQASPQFQTADEAMEFLGMSREQQQVIKLIRDARQTDLDKFSIYAVSRYAGAPKKRKGFGSGREQFAFDNQMTEKELLAAQTAEDILSGAFAESGLDKKRMINGYWPHLRKWVGSGNIIDAEHFPDDVRQWVATRYRAGELNVYEKDPLLSSYRHVRGLFMNRHFDPEMPGAMDAIRSISGVDERAASVMQEYAMELSGRPHSSFGNIESMINSSMKALLGKELEPGFAKNYVNGMAALTSAALLPFRPALIARNYFESLLKVAPRVGMSSYVKAVRYVNSPGTRKEAWKAAMDAGAIRPGVTKLRSVHQSNEIFTQGGLGFLGRAERIFNKGFEWYQHPDDWGRAVAFHAQRFRAAPHIDDFQQGRISMSELLDRAKVNTYDPLDVELVEEQFKNKNFNQALDHLGRTLSRESMTRYGYADHPVGWNSVAGRLMGQFGTWPVQYKDYLVQGLTRGSTKDKAEFMMLHGAVSGGIMGAGATVGLDLQSWTGFSSPYTGGPYADLVVDISKSLTGSEAEKSLARSNLQGQIPVWGWMQTGNPRSVFLPGSFVLGDIASATEAMQDGEVFNALMSGAGVRTLRADEPRPLEWVYGP